MVIMRELKESTVDLMQFMIVKPSIMKHIIPSLNPLYKFQKEDKLWLIRSASMDEAFYLNDELFKMIRFCEECFFILKEEKDAKFFYEHVREHVAEQSKGKEASEFFF